MRRIFFFLALTLLEAISGNVMGKRVRRQMSNTNNLLQSLLSGNQQGSQQLPQQHRSFSSSSMGGGGMGGGGGRSNGGNGNGNSVNQQLADLLSSLSSPQQSRRQDGGGGGRQWSNGGNSGGMGNFNRQMMDQSFPMNSASNSMNSMNSGRPMGNMFGGQQQQDLSSILAQLTGGGSKQGSMMNRSPQQMSSGNGRNFPPNNFQSRNGNGMGGMSSRQPIQQFQQNDPLVSLLQQLQQPQQGQGMSSFQNRPMDTQQSMGNGGNQLQPLLSALLNQQQESPSQRMGTSSQIQSGMMGSSFGGGMGRKPDTSSLLAGLLAQRQPSSGYSNSNNHMMQNSFPSQNSERGRMMMPSMNSGNQGYSNGMGMMGGGSASDALLNSLINGMTKKASVRLYTT